MLSLAREYPALALSAPNVLRPGIVGCEGLYDNTTTAMAMHYIEYPPPLRRAARTKPTAPLRPAQPINITKPFSAAQPRPNPRLSPSCFVMTPTTKRIAGTTRARAPL